jgi:hypothetical protein
MDQTTGLLTITSEQYTNLKNLNFVVGGETYALTPNAQIWPRSLNSVIGGNAGQIYLIVADVSHLFFRVTLVSFSSLLAISFLTEHH